MNIGKALIAAGIVEPLYVEDVFSSSIYTGAGGSAVLATGQDFAAHGGLAWLKRRNGMGNHRIFDTSRGGDKELRSNLTHGNYTDANSVTAWNSNGITIGTALTSLGDEMVAWTFRKAAKFFDVVTWTGDGASSKQIPHSLGKVPGMIVIKKIGTTSRWAVWHRSLADNHIIYLNETTASAADGFNPNPTDTEFTAQLSPGDGYNGNGIQYVAYLYSHDTSADGLIQCGGFSEPAPGVGLNVDVGFEPQFILGKPSGAVGPWFMFDTVRGWPLDTTSISSASKLEAQSANPESSAAVFGRRSTGFRFDTVYGVGTPWIYLLIRKGPMRS